MNLLEEIIQKHEELESYIKSVDIKELNTFSREELKEFRDHIYKIEKRHLMLEVKDLMDQKKVEEFPEILGVHRFPLLKYIPFLTEKQKVDLDEHLAKLRVGNYIFSLSCIGIPHGQADELMDWLVTNGVAEKKFSVYCPHCYEESVSDLLPESEKQELLDAIRHYQETFEERPILDVFQTYCDECNNGYEVRDLKVDCLSYNERYVLAMEADRTLELA